MRSPTVAELSLLARSLMRLPAGERDGAAKQILAEVDIAERYVLATGRCHTAFGDGSLAARCHLLAPQAEPLADDPDFLQALSSTVAAMLRHSRP